jgi:hypothetical protein
MKLLMPSAPLPCYVVARLKVYRSSKELARVLLTPFVRTVTHPDWLKWAQQIEEQSRGLDRQPAG